MTSEKDKLVRKMAIYYGADNLDKSDRKNKKYVVSYKGKLDLRNTRSIKLSASVENF